MCSSSRRAGGGGQSGWDGPEQVAHLAFGRLRSHRSHLTPLASPCTLLGVGRWVGGLGGVTEAAAAAATVCAPPPPPPASFLFASAPVSVCDCASVFLIHGTPSAPPAVLTAACSRSTQCTASPPQVKGRSGAGRSGRWWRSGQSSRRRSRRFGAGIGTRQAAPALRVGTDCGTDCGSDRVDVWKKSRKAWPVATVTRSSSYDRQEPPLPQFTFAGLRIEPPRQP